MPPADFCIPTPADLPLAYPMTTPARRVGRFAETRSVRWLRRMFRPLHRHAPAGAARLAYPLLRRQATEICR